MSLDVHPLQSNIEFRLPSGTMFRVFCVYICESALGSVKRVCGVYVAHALTIWQYINLLPHFMTGRDKAPPLSRGGVAMRRRRRRSVRTSLFIRTGSLSLLLSLPSRANSKIQDEDDMTDRTARVVIFRRGKKARNIVYLTTVSPQDLYGCCLRSAPLRPATSHTHPVRWYFCSSSSSFLRPPIPSWAAGPDSGGNKQKKRSTRLPI